MTKSIFIVKRENFLMGLKIDFKFEILGIFVQNPHLQEAIFFMRSDQKFGILFNRGFICIPIYYKKEIIFVGNIYFRIHLKVCLLFNQKLFLLYVNYNREISSYIKKLPFFQLDEEVYPQLCPSLSVLFIRLIYSFSIPLQYFTHIVRD